MPSIDYRTMEVIDGLDLDLLDKQIETLHQVEEDLIEQGRTLETDHITGLLNFLSSLYNALHADNQ